MQVTYQLEDPGADDTRDQGYAVVKWEAITSVDTMEALEVPVATYISVQVTGTFGFKGEVTFWGGICKDEDLFIQLPDEKGTPIFLTAPGIAEVGARMRYLQPRIKPGDGTTSVDIYLLAAR